MNSIVNKEMSDVNPSMILDQSNVHGRKRLQKGGTLKKTGDQKFLATGQWMEEERRNLQAYEYLCHVGEAKEWIEACIQEEISDSVAELDECLRDGVLLAKLAKFFAPDCVGKIFEAQKLQFRHSDNTNFFMRACRQAGFPEVFLFELTDVYDKKNIPKVIYCIHALSHFLAKKGIAPRIRNLVGKLQFTDEELQQTENSLAEAGLQLPQFGNVEGALAKELQEETPEELAERYWKEHEHQLILCQAQIRGVLARREYARRRSRDLPRIVKIQSLERGRQARKRYQAMRKHYEDNEDKVIQAQAFIKGFLARKQYQERQAYFRDPENLKKIARLQEWIRSKLLNKAFRELNDLDNITVSSIQSFLHIFDDSEKDLEEELELERLKKLVVKRIRANTQMDQLLNELDIKIALLVRNRITLDELIKTSSSKIYKKAGQQSGLATASAQSLNSLSGASLPTTASEFLFSSASFKSLDKESRQRLQLYENLFYLLQTQPQYLSQIVFFLKQTKIRTFMDQVVLPLFNFANGTREEYLLLKFFKALLESEMEDIADASALMRENPVFVKLVVHYNRGAKEREFLRDLLQPLVKEIVADKKLDFETDPLSIWRNLIKMEESKTGEKSERSYDISREQALSDPDVQRVLKENLDSLQQDTELFLGAIVKSLDRMPYGIRYIAKELKQALTQKFNPKTAEDNDQILRVVGNLVYYRYMNPAIVAPEGFDVIEQLISPLQRKNLAEVSKMLQLIANNKVFDSDAAHMSSLNEYLAEAGQRMTSFFAQVTGIPEAEDYFQLSELSDLLQTSKPIIYITPQSIFNTHALVHEILDDIAPKADDPLRILINQLDVPAVESVTVDYSGSGKYEDSSSSSGKEGHEISLMLCNRLIETSILVGFGENAEIAVDFRNLLLEVKKSVIMVLRIQTGQNLVDILKKDISEKDEDQYQALVRRENEAYAKRTANQQSSSITIHVEYPQTFADLKANVMEQLQKLEELFVELCKVEPNDLKREQMGLVPVAKTANYQGLLKSIGLDIRQKQRRRAQRQSEINTIKKTLKNLEEKMKYLEEQKQSYQDYINSCMAQLTINRKRPGAKKSSNKFLMPFTPQWHHMQQLKKEGKVPEFGSFKYSADVLYKRGILVSLDDRSPNQLDKITLTISSDEPGVFNVEVDFMGIKMPQKMELKLEDLLQYQFDNTQIVSLFDGAAKVNVNLLIYLINKKFYK